MPPSNRKRSSAFEDFPEPSESQGSKLSFSTPENASPAAQIERIERLKPSQMLPDRFQPRRLLPTILRAAFFSGQIDCYQAARQWLSLAKEELVYQDEIDRLLAMGTSFDEHGQIKPITGSWVPANDGQYIFLIETGERRFWAACLRAAKDNQKEEPLLRIEVVQKPTRFRQVLENRHAESPSAVGQACEVAALILAELKIEPPTDPKDEFEFFRQARNQRMPAGLWDNIIPMMQLTRPRMVQLLNILQLPSSLLDIADRARLPERVLREILSLPHSEWERTLRMSVQKHLTSDDLVELKNSPVASPSPRRNLEETYASPSRTALSGLRRFGNALTSLDEVSQSQAMDEIADSLVASRQAEGMMNLLGELNRLVQMRISRR
jgi:hypothetical protein